MQCKFTDCKFQATIYDLVKHLIKDHSSSHHSDALLLSLSAICNDQWVDCNIKLSDGSIYSGQLVSNTPHGFGLKCNNDSFEIIGLFNQGHLSIFGSFNVEEGKYWGIRDCNYHSHGCGIL